jgi:CubicO group peptidase (beta-lactamase class C family)
VTIRRLLSHTAGLNIHGYLGVEPDRKIPSLEGSLSGEGTLNKKLKIDMLPGNSFSYSGGGYTLLQLVIEEVTGKAFEQYMEEEILKPLGMEKSSYRNNIENENMSKGYGYFGQEVPANNFSEQTAAGLKTTVPDMLKFIMASMNIAGSGVLKDETIDLIHKPVLSTAALGVFTEALPDGSRLFEHGGDNRGWHGIYGFIPEKKDGIVIFINSDNGIDMREELFYHWIEYETGTMPDRFYAMERARNIKLIGAAALGIMLAVHPLKHRFLLHSCLPL